MIDLGQLSYFLGILVTRTRKSMFLFQQKCVEEIIHQVKMDNCKPMPTPVDAKSKRSDSDGDPVLDPSLGVLQVLYSTSDHFHSL